MVARHPDDFDASYELGDLLFHVSPSRGVSVAVAREPLARAVMLDPSRSAEPLFHLMAIAALDGRRRDLDSLGMRFLSLHPAGELSIAVRSILALERRDSAATDQVARELAGRPTQQALNTVAVALGLASDFDGGLRLLAPLDDPSRVPGERAAVVIARARLAGGQGKWALADSLFARARSLDTVRAIEARARLLSLPIGDPSPASMRSARADLGNAPGGASQPNRRLLAGLLAIRLGDVTAAKRTANELAAVSPNDRSLRALWAELAARSFLVDGRSLEALAVLEAVRAPGPPLRFLRGEVLQSLGRTEEALRWYEVAAQDYSGELYRTAIATARVRLSAARR